MKNPDNTDIILIGGVHHNILGVIRSLGEKGIHPIVIVETDEKRPYIAYSKYIKKLHICKDGDEIVSLLMNTYAGKEEKPVIAICSDQHSSLIDQKYDLLSQYFILPGARQQGVITSYMNKETMSKHAENCGMLIPKSSTILFSKLKDLKPTLPCIIKPIISKDGAKSDIKKCFIDEDWESFTNSKHVADEFQIQQYIEKEFEYQLIGLSLDYGETIIIPGVSIVLRPSEFSNTGFLKYIPKEDFERFNEIYDKCKVFIKTIGYSGLFSMEFIRSLDGKDYFMEINFRNDGNAICVTASGINLPYLLYMHSTGNDVKSIIESKKAKTVYVMPEINDFYLVFRRKLSFFTWIKDLFRTDCFMEWSRKDPKPFFIIAADTVKQFIRKKTKQ